MGVVVFVSGSPGNALKILVESRDLPNLSCCLFLKKSLTMFSGLFFMQNAIAIRYEGQWLQMTSV